MNFNKKILLAIIANTTSLLAVFLHIMNKAWKLFPKWMFCPRFIAVIFFLNLILLIYLIVLFISHQL